MIKKVSEITASDVAEYIRCDTEAKNELETYINVAKSFISKSTGLPVKSTDGNDDLDTYSEFVIAVLVLCQDMYDNRTLYVEKSNVNRVVQTILDMHCRCLL